MFLLFLGFVVAKKEVLKPPVLFVYFLDFCFGMVFLVLLKVYYFLGGLTKRPFSFFF